MDPDGKNQIRLTTNNVQNSAPSWSPDSKSIVFNSSSTVGTNQICKIQISDSVENCLKIDFKNAFEPTWQPYPSY
jgi:Tol biopolymer transport system component